MAAIPLTDPRILTLICDGCGSTLGGLSCYTEAWPVLRDVAAELGWVGAGSPGGPHSCPRCRRPGGGAGPVPPGAVTLQGRLGRYGGTAVLALAGDVDAAVSGDLSVILDHLLTSHNHVVLDLSAVNLIDSTALGVLVRARTARPGRDTRLCLAAPSHFVRAVLASMRLDSLLPVFDTIAGAAVARPRCAGPGR